MADGVERPRLTQAVAGRMRRIKMRAGNPSIRHRLGRRMGSAAFQKFGQHMGVRSIRTFSRRGRNRLIHLDPAEPADEDAMRIGVKDQSHRRIAGLRTPRGRYARAIARWFRDRSIRTQKSACNAPRPRSNRIEPRSCGRNASRSAPSSVSTVRRFIAQSSSGRQSAIRWFQPVLVVLSEANGRLSAWCRSAMPPRAVTAETDSADRVSTTGFIAVAREFGDGAEGAETPLRVGIGDLPVQQIDRRIGRGRGKT